MSNYLFNRQALKAFAKNKISITNFFLVVLIVWFIPYIVDYVPSFQYEYAIDIFGLHLSYSGVTVFAFILTYIIPLVLRYWMVSYSLYVTKTEGEVMDSLKFAKTLDISHLFNFMIKKLVVDIAVTAGVILFIVPGIYLALTFAQTEYIAVEHPELSIIDTMKLSDHLMSGYRFSYFVMILSFLGWSLLSSFTFGILGFYLIPYMELTYASFYYALIRDIPDHVDTVLKTNSSLV